MWASHRGAKVGAAKNRELGRHPLTIKQDSPLFSGIKSGSQVLQSHGDRIELGPQIDVLAATDNAPVAAGHLSHLWGVQFHPEVTASEDGAKLLENFVFAIAGAKDRFPSGDVA